MLRRMSAADRASLGRVGLTALDAAHRFNARHEKELHQLAMQELNRRDLFYVRSRMDKRATIAKGMPDFFIVVPGGRVLAVEFKLPGEEVSDDQQRVFTKFWDQTGCIVHIALSFEQFLAILNQHLAARA